MCERGLGDALFLLEPARRGRLADGPCKGFGSGNPASTRFFEQGHAALIDMRPRHTRVDHWRIGFGGSFEKAGGRSGHRMPPAHDVDTFRLTGNVGMSGCEVEQDVARQFVPLSAE